MLRRLGLYVDSGGVRAPASFCGCTFKCIFRAHAHFLTLHFLRFPSDQRKKYSLQKLFPRLISSIV